MVRASLSDAVGRVRDTPVLFIPGLYLGALLTLVLLLQLQGGQVMGARAGFLGLVGLPFFLGGCYGVIRGGGQDIRAYFRAGAQYYARILLAGAIFISVAFLTVFLVLIPFTMAGGPAETLATPVILGVLVPMAFFAYFADTVAVLEDRKVLDSIRRSVEFTLSDPKRTVLFYLANLAICLLVLFISVTLWSFAVAGNLLPVVEANQTLLQAMTPDQLMGLVGPAGFWSGLAIAFCAALAVGTILPAFKASFFLRHASPSGIPPQGEFDEKGRWYRY